jgi:hypothetical protein
VQSVGWAFVVALTALGLYRGIVEPTSAPSALGATLGDWTGGGFEAERVHGRWLDNATGPVFVVSGRIRHDGTPRVRLPVIRLTNASGEPVAVAPVPLGPELGVHALRETAPEQLAARQRRNASPFASTIEDWREFHAVVPEVPDAADRFAFDLASPGARL